MANTAISFKGSRDEVYALRILAARQKVSVGALVRNAIDAQYATDMAEILDSFFASGERQINQTSETRKRSAASS